MAVTQYHLGKFPPGNLDWARLVPAIGRAHFAVAAYGALLESMPNPESTEGRPWGQPLKKAEGAPLNLG